MFINKEKPIQCPQPTPQVHVQYFCLVNMTVVGLFYVVVMRIDTTMSNSIWHKALNIILNRKTMKILFLLCLVNLAFSGPLSQHLKPLQVKDHLTEPHNSSFIIGGRPADYDEAPYQVAIDLISKFCGGSIIGTEWILTAAHCVNDYFAFQITIRYGTLTYYKGGFTAHISSIYVHDEYNSVTVDNDIALLRTSWELSLGMSNAEAISLPSSDYLPSYEYLSVSGWGRTQENIITLSDALQIVEVEVMSEYRCKQIYGNRITDNMFCAYTYGKDACYGDSGGPAALNSYEKELVGIVSWGSGCGVYPGVYTRVSKYIDWINMWIY